MASGAWLDKLGETLSLTDAQKDQIKADVDSIKPTVEAHHALFGKVVEAFKGDQFSMEQVVPNYDPAKHAVEVAGMMVKATQEAAKILTPEQRKLAAEKIRERVGGAERPAAPTGVAAPTGAPAAMPAIPMPAPGTIPAPAAMPAPAPSLPAPAPMQPAITPLEAAPAPTGQTTSPLEEETGSSEDAQLVAPVAAPFGVGTAFGGLPTG